MKLPAALLVPLILLGIVHLLVLFAGFFSPYGFATQDRESPYHPPTRIHWIDRYGSIVWHPFVYGSIEQTGNPGSYEEDMQVAYPIRYWRPGPQYTIAGLFSSQRHLFGVDSPARIYVMGTDGYGRDVLSRLLYGGQISLFTGLLATFLSLTAGLVFGCLAGFYGSWVDAVIMRGVELFMALPWLYLLLALRAFLPLHIGPVQAFLLLIAVIGLVGWARPARLIRGVVLSTRERKYLLAARCFGASDFYLLRRHALPETRAVVLTQAALLIPQYVLAEVTLSFLGLGMAEPVPSWGSMLASLQQYHVLVSAWWMFFPGILMVIVFLTYGMLANVLQKKSSRLGAY